MSRTDTWMPLYIADYLVDTMRLTTVQHGAYLLLLMEYWRQGPLPDNDDELSTIAKTDRKTWDKTIKSSVRRFFEVQSDGLLHQKRIDSERKKAVELSDKRRTAAQQRGNKPSDKQDSKPEAIAEQLLTNSIRDVAALQPSLSRDLSPLTKEDSVSLRSTGDDAPEPVKADLEPDVKAVLWRQGVAILRALTGQADGPVRKLMGKMVDAAGADHAMLFDILRQAEIHQPDQPTAWIRAAIQSRTNPTLLTVVDNATPDPYGIRAWTNRQPDWKWGRVNGEDVPCINGYGVEAIADQIAMHVGLPVTWRGNWDALGAWMREDIQIFDEQLRAMADFARSITGTISSIKLFDSIVRGGQRAA